MTENPRPAGPRASSADLAAQAFREQLRMVFELVPGAVLASAVLTGVVFLVLLPVAPRGVLLLWAGVMFALTGVRAAVMWRYARRHAAGHDQAHHEIHDAAGAEANAAGRDRRYALWYFVPFVLTGLGWGLLPVGVVPAGDPLFTILAIGAVYGLAGGSAAFVGHLRLPYGAFLLATMLPTAAKWLSDWWEEGGTYRLVVGGATLVLMLLLYSASRQLNRLVAGAIEVRLEKEALARRLQELVATVERANQAKSDFLVRMGNQLQAPLTTIAGQSRGLLGEPLTPGQRESVLQVQDTADGLLAMLADVLDYSQIESGQLQIARAGFDLGGVLARTTAAARLHAQAKGLAFNADIAPGLPQRVLGDERRLTQILASLLANAVQFTASGTVGLEVREVSAVSAEGGRHTLSFAVSDSGSGIAQDRVHGIFQAYAPGTAEPHLGSGLSLALCRRLAGLMHGALAVQCGPAGGSIFTLVLPLHAAPSAAPDAQPAGPWEAREARGAREARVGSVPAVQVEHTAEPLKEPAADPAESPAADPTRDPALGLVPNRLRRAAGSRYTAGPRRIYGAVVL